MGRSVVRTILALSLATAVLVGCAQDEGAGPGDDAAATPDAKTGAEEAAETPSPEPTSTVVPVTGKYLELETGRMRAPEGWQHDELISTMISASDVDSLSWVSMGEILFVREAPLDEIAENSLTNHTTSSPDVRRLPDVTLDGREVYHFAGIEDPEGVIWYEEFGAMHNGMKLTVFVRLDTTKYTTEAERQEFVDSLLATFEWA
ncbi:hypothetical protein [Nocardioides campestrisoli]|uniref:hypothetical protein n=1 Tax=Nocardioides campestrisoli TaxID=2736757 RepID=UPI0015E7D125|nr:hypothetical protein [Nocardioides campestrisoli]